MSNEYENPIRTRCIAEDLLARYCDLLDEQRLDDWAQLFAKDASYRILSRENLDQGLPAAILLLETRDSIVDRIVALRETAVFNIHRSRRFYSGLQTAMSKTGRVNFSANIGVYQTDQEGHSKLFLVGRIDGICAPDASTAPIERIEVTVDTFTVPTLLAIPI